MKKPKTFAQLYQQDCRQIAACVARERRLETDTYHMSPEERKAFLAGAGVPSIYEYQPKR